MLIIWVFAEDDIENRVSIDNNRNNLFGSESFLSFTEQTSTNTFKIESCTLQESHDLDIAIAVYHAINGAISVSVHKQSFHQVITFLF